MGLLSTFAGPLIMLALVGGLYGAHKVAVWNAGRAATKVAVAQCDADKQVIRDRATALANLWSVQVDKTEAAQRAAESRSNATFGSLTDRANAVQHGGGITLPFDVVGVRRAASAAVQPPRPTKGDSRAATPIPGPAPAEEQQQPQVFDESVLSLDEVKKAQAYDSALKKWQGCVNFYDNLRQTKLPETSSGGLFDWFKSKEK